MILLKGTESNDKHDVCHLVLINDKNSHKRKGEVRLDSLKLHPFYKENNNERKIKGEKATWLRIRESNLTKSTKGLLVHCVYQAFAREDAKFIATDVNESTLQELEKH